MKKRMKEWEKNIRKVEPYVPGEQPNKPDMVKLNTNENPYPPAPEVERAWKQFSPDSLKLYPDPTANVLTGALADYHKVTKEQVFVGVGSDDVWANLFQIPYRRPALKEDFHIRAEDYFTENGGIVIANPNAPTGLMESLDFLEQILEKNQDVIVIVDEAYVDFGGESALSLLPKYENLLVVRTFSKSRSLAGLRIGYAVGNEALIKAMNDVKYSYNSYTMNRTSLALGAAVLENEAYFQETVQKIIATRERTKKALSELGFTFPDSKANFIFASHKRVKAKDIFEELRKENIYVRYFEKPKIDNYLRITIGTDREMDRFLAKLKEILDRTGI